MQEKMTGAWKQFAGKVKEKWGQLTDDDIMQAQGNIDQLVGKIQQKYGGNAADIRRQLEEMMR